MPTRLSETDFEVELTMEANAGEGDEAMFKVELIYCGVFRLENLPEEAKAPAILDRVPAHAVPIRPPDRIADATRNGGFPPLLIDPIDFAALYQQRAAEEQIKSQVKTDAN